MQKDPFESATLVEDYAIYESGLIAHGCLEHLDQYTREAIMRYGRLLIEKYKLSLIEHKPNNMAEIELDTADWDKELLIYLIQQSCDKDVSVNAVISELLGKYIDILKENPDEQAGLVSETEEKTVE